MISLFAICLSCQKDSSKFEIQTEHVPGFEALPHIVAASFQNLKTSSDNQVELKIDIDDYYSSGIGISDLARKVSYVRLESDSLIGEIDDLFFRDDHWYIVDQRMSKSVFQFKKDGSLVGQIGRNGTGPGEFIDPTNVSVSDAGVHIHSEFQGSIFSYDLNGTYRGTLRVPFLFDDFHEHKNGMIFNTFNRKNGHIESIANNMLVLTNHDLDIEGSGGYYDPKLYSEVSMGFAKSLKEHNREFYYLQPFSRTLSRVNPDTGEENKLIQLDFGNQNIPTSLIKSNPQGPLLNEIMDKGYACVTDYLVNDDYFIFKVVYRNRLLNLYYHRDSNKISGGAVVVDNFDNLNSINPSFLLNNKLISLLEPMDILKYGDELKKADFIAYQRLFEGAGPLANLHEMDNIVLRIHELD